MKRKRFIPLFALACFLGCSAQTGNSVRDENRQELRKAIADQQEHIAPDRCRIIGTLVTIDTTLEESGPCSKAPCRGIVRVDSVLGYGSAFGNPVAMHGEIAVRFAFTLVPTTKELFPNMTERLPGLNVGSKFKADLQSQNEMYTSGSQTWYLVYNYQRLN